jgi:hypothetical protein
MDIDLMGRTDNSLEHIRFVVEEICGLAVEQDGVEFRGQTIEILRIKEEAEYEGARVRLTATVAKARLVVQIDIGFGDSIVPRPDEIEYPVLLEFPVPKLLAYPKETVVAEKLEAITVLGVLNSRMKDYFDHVAFTAIRVRWCRPSSSSESDIQTTFHGSRAYAHWPFGRLRVGTGKGCAVESISSQEQIRSRLCKSRWRHKNSAGFCWTRINSRRISVSLEAWWAVGNLGRNLGLGSTTSPNPSVESRKGVLILG